DVLAQGVIEGRKVFCNMMKYIQITLSSNFGNVFTILIASAFLPFLPMISLQLLVQNLIYDMAQLALPWDNVDASQLIRPSKWKLKDLTRYTFLIGPVSSIFDILTFLLMWFVFGANTVSDQALFQTGWFAIGLTTQTLAVYILRTQKIPFVQSHASIHVTLASIAAIVLGAAFVLTPLGEAIDFVALPSMYWF